MQRRCSVSSWREKRLRARALRESSRQARWFQLPNPHFLLIHKPIFAQWKMKMANPKKKVSNCQPLQVVVSEVSALWPSEYLLTCLFFFAQQISTPAQNLQSFSCREVFAFHVCSKYVWATPPDHFFVYRSKCSQSRQGADASRDESVDGMRVFSSILAIFLSNAPFSHSLQ
jgi:hypothetical protein